MNTFLRFFIFMCCGSLFGEQTVLVTGGAGYIGSHLCYALKKAGFNPVVYDSLINGSEETVKWGPFVKGDLHDSETLDHLFSTYKPVAVFHLAGLIYVGESMVNPYRYYRDNVSGTLNLLQIMLKHGVKNLIFSSSSSIYGNPEQFLIKEEHPKNPVSAYARTKWFVEQILEDFDRAYGIKYAALRYFNVGGANLEAGLKKPITCHLISSILLALSEGRTVAINGIDYPTPDGTAVRDYIHVMDIADAHIAALKYVEDAQKSIALNIGTGKGSSVLEIISVVEEVTNQKVQTLIGQRREGDAIRAVADSSKAEEVVGFKTKYSDLENIIQSEWSCFIPILENKASF